MEELNKLMNEINWLISLLVAIPLSIAGNLLTPLFQNWKSRKSQSAARQRLKVVEKELEQATRLYADPGQLNTYLLVSLLAVIVLFSLPNVFGGLFSMLFVFQWPVDSNLARMISAASGMFSALFNLMAIVRATQAITLYQRVRDFTKYEPETKTLLEQLRANAA